MEHLIQPRVKELEMSGIRKFFNLVADYDDVVSLTIGQPDFFTPHHVKAAAKKAIDDNFTSYTHNAGFLELRKAASDYLFKKYKLSYRPEDEMIVTAGASQAIDLTLRTILAEGSEVILPGPVYPGYEPIIKLCGAIPVHADTTRTQFKLTAEQIEARLTDRTRCVILPYPSNPTGMTLEKEELEKIAQLLRGRDIFVLSDEIYSELVFTDAHSSIASMLPEQTIVINGLSKSHSMTGWRIGFVFARKEIAKHMLKVHQYNVSCASSISQKAAFEALTNGIDDALIMRDQYRKRMEYVYGRLIKMGIETARPTGAFYIFPSIKKFGLSSFDFALSLVSDGGVAVVPGSAFSKYGEGFVRISYAYSMEELEKGMDRLDHYIRHVVQPV
ncbi:MULTISPECIES: aminotransferase A [Bacillaceae]|uniref:Aminotransferase n=1 Tax=Metabacillus sediminis TaxID=3117746 RepID=A0ABZ2NLQ7_9BACI|nr:aminotransferase A [Bacillus sp. SJS]KZZ85244.1 aromatic amino acid aminotransferase [Bacillus sp. SJS]